MGMRAPDHITLAVQDPDAAVRFFSLLGFEKTHVALIAGGEPASYMGLPDMTADHITLTLDGAEPPFEIQLLHFHDLDGQTPDDGPSHHRRIGFNHLAFQVDDVPAMADRLVAEGVEMISPEMDYISRKLRFFAGPEGITLELVERDDA